MNNFTMPFIPGTQYLFTPRKGAAFGASMGTSQSDYQRRLTFLRDVPGNRWVVLHIFRLKGGALETFTDQQAGDYEIKKI